METDEKSVEKNARMMKHFFGNSVMIIIKMMENGRMQDGT